MSNKTILCVDDSATMRTIVEKTFFSEPYEVISVPSGEVAIAKAKELKPSLVLADAGMVGTTGYDVCKAIRADSVISGIPVVIMSGVSSPYDENLAREVGVTDHVKKPFDTSKLIERIAELCGGVAVMASPTKAPPTKAPVAAEVAASIPKPAQAPISPPVQRTVAPVQQSATTQVPPSPLKHPGTAPALPFKPPVPPVPRHMAPKNATMPMPTMGKPAIKETMEFARPSGIPQMSAKPEPIPIELDEPAMPESDIQVGTLAELAQMNEKGEQIAHMSSDKAIELGDSVAKSEPAMRTEPKASKVESVARIAGDNVAAGIEGLTPEQAEAIRKLTAEVIERVVWEVVPDLAETIIRETIEELLEE